MRIEEILDFHGKRYGRVKITFSFGYFPNDKWQNYRESEDKLVYK